MSTTRTPDERAGLRTSAWRGAAAFLARAATALVPAAWLTVLCVDVGATFAAARIGWSPLASSACGFVVLCGLVAIVTRGSMRHVALLALFAVPLRAGLVDALDGGWVASLASAAVTASCFAGGLALVQAKRASTAFGAALVIALTSYAFALRTLYAASIDVIPEEAYYTCYARHLALGYFDHPPLVAWMIAATTALLGTSELAVRAGALALAVALAWLLARATAAAYGRSAAWIAVALACALPYFFAIGLLATPEAPLAVAWAGALLGLRRALLDGRASGWIFAGACIGLGLLAKYTIVLLVPAALAFVVIDRPSRRWLAHPAPYVGLALALLMFTPVIVWNARNEWASFLFQTQRRATERMSFSLDELVLGVLVMTTPIGVAGVWRALRARVDGARTRERAFTAAMLLVPLGVFTLNSLIHSTRLHWTGPIWIAAVPMLAAQIARSGSQPWSLRPRTWMRTSVAMLALFGWTLLYAALGMPGLPASVRARAPTAWSELAARVHALRAHLERDTGRPWALVGMDKHFLASELSFYAAPDARERITSRHLFGRNGFMFEQWEPSARYDGADLLAVSLTPELLDGAKLEANATTLGPLLELRIERRDRDIGAVFVREVRGYRAPEHAPAPFGAQR